MQQRARAPGRPARRHRQPLPGLPPVGEERFVIAHGSGGTWPGSGSRAFLDEGPSPEGRRCRRYGVPPARPDLDEGPSRPSPEGRRRHAQSPDRPATPTASPSPHDQITSAEPHPLSARCPAAVDSRSRCGPSLRLLLRCVSRFSFYENSHDLFDSITNERWILIVGLNARLVWEHPRYGFACLDRPLKEVIESIEDQSPGHSLVVFISYPWRTANPG